MKKGNYDSMVGTLQEYRGQQYVIKNVVEHSDETVEVITNKKVIKETVRGMGQFVLLQTAQELAQSNSTALAIASKDSSLTRAADAILESIDRLKSADVKPADIERARAINESAQVITNMAKVQLDIIRTARDLR